MSELRVFIMNMQFDHTRKGCFYQKKLLIGNEHQYNTEANCSRAWTSIWRPAFVASWSLQRRSNVFVPVLVSQHWFIRLVFMWVNWRDLLYVSALHVSHVFGVANDIRDAKAYLGWANNVFCHLVALLSLLLTHHLSLWLFLLLFFMNCLELIVRPE